MGCRKFFFLFFLEIIIESAPIDMNLFNVVLQTGKCSHQTAYKYFAESIYSEQPLLGYFCDSLNDVKTGSCMQNHRKTVMGGEPGAKQQ